MDRSTKPSREVFEAWKDLVNMSPAELRVFLSEYGEEAGLSRAEARSEGVRSGRESAQWILKMRAALPQRTYSLAERNWTPSMWEWARRQVAFNRRMRGMRGPLYREYKDGSCSPTRKLLALLVWGHDPERYDTGKRSELLTALLRMRKT
jgi:hypothetical protein